MASKPFRIGKLFANRYRIEAQLGEGAMGVVYRVRDVDVGEEVALKALMVGLVRRDQALARFRREVRLSRRVTHPNVVRMHDIGHHDETHYLTMELVDGVALDALLADRERLGPAMALDISIQVARALTAAHAAGVIHRDLKPSNILLERAYVEGKGGRVVVTDFGIARSLAGEMDGAQTQGAIGTPHYMAPEQVEGKDVDERTDLYALGGVLYQMLTGKLAFREKTPMATALARLAREAPDPRETVPLPAGVAEHVLQCLSREPKGRPASAELLAQELEHLAASASISGIAATQLEMPAASATPAMASPTRSGADIATDRTEVQGEPPRGLSVHDAATRAQSRAPTLPSGRALAVLPFRVRGARDDLAAVGDALSDELIDVLARTRGVRVFASSATERFRESRDPTQIGDELGADIVVDGTLQRSGDRVRLSARMIDVTSRVQTWTERFDGRFEDVFQLQEEMSLRIAEALRLELVHGQAVALDADAVEAYSEARARLRNNLYVGKDGAQKRFEVCLKHAPTFKPALAGYAMACVLAWFEPDGTRTTTSGMRARDAVARALLEAPELPETHLAAATLASNDGDYERTAESLGRALELAPSYASALGYLGMLQAESGRIDTGIGRMEMAYRLDPSLTISIWSVARLHALRGDYDLFEGMMDQAAALGRATHAGHVLQRMRVASWRGDLDRLEELSANIQYTDDVSAGLLSVYSAGLRGDMDLDQIDKMLSAMLPAFINQRFATLACQLACEFYTLQGRLDLAERYLKAAVDRVLVDLAWLDMCPLLAPLRELRSYDQLRRVVKGRAEAFWGKSATVAP